MRDAGTLVAPRRRLMATVAAGLLVLGAPVLPGFAATHDRPAVVIPPRSTTVSGVLESDANWTVDGSPYVVEGQLAVAVNATLTIDPGVEVRFSPGASLTVGGVISAIGTAEAGISFLGTEEETGSWMGIAILGSDDAPASGRFAHVTVAHGGAGFYGAQLYTSLGSLEVTDSQVRDGSGDGIVADAATLRLDGVSVTDNTGVGVRVIGMPTQPPSGPPVIADLDVAGNGTDSVWIEQPGLISADLQLRRLGVPYRIAGQMMIAPNASLTIDPGVILELDVGTEIFSQGTLKAIGTPESPITFRGAASGPGAWSGIHIAGDQSTPAVARFEHVVISGAGGAEGLEPALSVSDGTVTFLSGEIVDASGNGLEVSGLAALGATRIEGSKVVRIAGHGVANSGDTAVLATNNWWGSSAGPSLQDECVPNGGTSISGLVHHSPWLDREDATPDPWTPSDRLVVTLAPQRWYAPADGQTRVWVDLVLRDPNGNPLPGRTVRLSTTHGEVVDGGVTDAAGHTLAYLVAVEPGDATLAASIEGLAPCDVINSNDVLVTFTSAEESLVEGMRAPYMFEGIDVDPLPVTEGVPTTLRATIQNPNAQAVTVEVQFELADYGLGLAFGPIGEPQTREIPAGGEVVFETAWTPPVPGHVCVQVLYHVVGSPAAGPLAFAAWGGLPQSHTVLQASAGAGSAQINLDAHRPTVGSRSAAMPSRQSASVANVFLGSGTGIVEGLGGLFAADETNHLIRVDDVTATFQVGNPFGEAATIDLRVRPVSLPAGWAATVAPASVLLGPGERVNATVVISSAGPTVEGSIARVAIEGFVGDVLVGGVVQDVVVPGVLPQPTTSQVPAVLPWILGGLVALVVLVAAWWALRRRGRSSASA